MSHPAQSDAKSFLASDEILRIKRDLGGNYGAFEQACIGLDFTSVKLMLGNHYEEKDIRFVVYEVVNQLKKKSAKGKKLYRPDTTISGSKIHDSGISTVAEYWGFEVTDVESIEPLKGIAFSNFEWDGNETRHQFRCEAAWTHELTQGVFADIKNKIETYPLNKITKAEAAEQKLEPKLVSGHDDQSKALSGYFLMSKEQAEQHLYFGGRLTSKGDMFICFKKTKDDNNDNDNDNIMARMAAIIDWKTTEATHPQNAESRMQLILGDYLWNKYGGKELGLTNGIMQFQTNMNPNHKNSFASAYYFTGENGKTELRTVKISNDTMLYWLSIMFGGAKIDNYPEFPKIISAYSLFAS